MTLAASASSGSLSRGRSAIASPSDLPNKYGSSEASSNSEHPRHLAHLARATRRQAARAESDIRDPTALRRRVTQQLVKEWNTSVSEKQEKDNRCSRCLAGIVDSKFFIGLGAILTIWALIGDNLRLMYTHRPTDYIFNIITVICIVLFLAEIILGSISKEDYFLGFFFMLDSISTVTLVMDLTFVNEAMLEGDEEDLENIKSSKTARLGARSARIVRVLRLIRILKLWKALSEARSKRRRRQQQMDDWDDDDEEVAEGEVVMHYLQESQVGKKLSELTTRRIVVIVLAMMVVVPSLELGEDLQLPNSFQYGAEVVHGAFLKLEGSESFRRSYDKVLLNYIFYHSWFAQLEGCPGQDSICPADYWGSVFWFGISGADEEVVKAKAQQASLTNTSAKLFYEEARMRESLFNYGSPLPAEIYPVLTEPWTTVCRSSKTMVQMGVSLLANAIPGKVNYAAKCPDDLRILERSRVAPRVLTKAQYREWHFTFYIDDRPLIKIESTCNLMLVAFICVVLAVSSWMISSDANNLILRPLEGMMLKIQMIRINPLMATKLADDAFKAEEKRKFRKLSRRGARWSTCTRYILCQFEEVPDRPMETRILENTIIKLGTLLALGFGEAGANITSRNMSSAHHGSWSGMAPGTHVDCIIGLASIADFGVLTEALHNNVMKFVNQVAEIVHGIIEEFSGAPNRNNGDSFLVIWTTAGLSQAHIAKLADMSMFAFVRIFAAVHSSRLLAAYRDHPLLKQRMGAAFRVNLTFGLHYGWAIEGAVGTEFKIDALYLSPHVSIAESIERATKLYRVNLLVTEAVLQLCTPAMAAKCRLIDNIIVVGAAMRLYCIDLNSMFVDVEPVFTLPNWNSRQRFRARQVLDAAKILKWHEDVHIMEYFSHSLEISALRMPYSKDFSYIFNMGYQNYHEGEWSAAEKILANTNRMLGFEDGPSSALLQFMKDPHNFVAPEWWRGVHNLDADIGGLSLVPRDSGSRALKPETLRCEGQIFPGLRETANPGKQSRNSSRSFHSGTPTASPSPRSNPSPKATPRLASIPESVLKGQARSVLKARIHASGGAKTDATKVDDRSVSRAVCMSEVALEEPAISARVMR